MRLSTLRILRAYTSLRRKPQQVTYFAEENALSDGSLKESSEYSIGSKEP